MPQAAFLDCQFLDFIPFFDNGVSSAKVDISWGDIVQALMVAVIVVVIDKVFDPLLYFGISDAR